MSEKQTSADSWDGLLINYLKADQLKEQTDIFACIGVKVDGENMDLDLQRGEENTYVFSLNKTNKAFLKNNGITAPKDVIGKKLTLEKVKATNPTTKQEVDSLRIIKVE